MSGINPTVIYIGMIVLAIASGIAEAFHLSVVPSGTASTIVGAIIGGGLFHAGSIVGSSTTTQGGGNTSGKN